MNFGPYYKDFLPRLIIDNVSLEITNLTTQFIGSNGVGKSVFLNCIKEQLLKENISFSKVDQDYRKNWLWWLDTIDNLLFAINNFSKKKYTRKNFWENPDIIKESYWLKDLLNKKPTQRQFHSDSEFKSDFSGGQLQRLIIFREWLHKPKYFLLDESFSALDKSVSLEIINWLKKLQKEYKFYIVAVVHNQKLSHQLGGDIKEFFLDDNSRLIIK